MNLKQTILAIIFVFTLSGTALISTPVYATDCEDIKTSIIPVDCDEDQDGLEGTALWGLLILIINILTAGVGIAAVGGVAYAAILYASSGGDIEKTKKSKTMLVDIAIGIAMYALMFSLLNYLIPGGMFN